VAVKVHGHDSFKLAAAAPDMVNPEHRNERDQSGADNVALPIADPLVAAPLPLTVMPAGPPSEATETGPVRWSPWAVALYDAER